MKTKGKRPPWGYSAKDWADILAGNAEYFGIDQRFVDAIEANRISFAARWKKKKRPGPPPPTQGPGA